MELLNGFGKNKLPSVIKDPFIKNKVKRINVTYQDFWDDGKWAASGTVSFKNGDTAGEHNFKGETFDEVVMQIKIMLDNLKQ